MFDTVFSVKIAVVSDTHGNAENLAAALSAIKSMGITTILHCGDIGDPDLLELFKELDAYFALGNMDTGYSELLRRTRSPSGESNATGKSGPHRIAPYHKLIFDGVGIAFCHGHTETLDRLVSSECFQFVFHGHTHKRKNITIDTTSSIKTRIINPGALGGARNQTRSFCIVDLEVGTPEFFEVPEISWQRIPRRIDVLD